MYVQQANVQALQSYIDGYNAALSVHGVVEPPPWFAHFPDWLQASRGWSQEAGWAASVRARSSSEQHAMESFFNLFDEFSRLTVTERVPIPTAEGERCVVELWRYASVSLYFLVLQSGSDCHVGPLLRQWQLGGFVTDGDTANAAAMSEVPGMVQELTVRRARLLALAASWASVNAGVLGFDEDVP